MLVVRQPIVEFSSIRNNFLHNDVKVSTSAYYTLQQSVNIECIVNNITKWMEEYVTLKNFDYSLIIRYVYLRRSETVLLRNGFAVCCVVFVEVVAVLFSEALLERLLIAAFEGEEVGIQRDIDAA